MERPFFFQLFTSRTSMTESTTPKVRTRFAPSPTGYVHMGTLRTGLFSFLLARHSGGTNILRIEDTDQSRLVPGALENLVEVLYKLGVEFDEGYFWDPESNSVKEKGDYGPYLQSKRLGLYEQYARELVEKGSAYYCFCSEERLEELRAEQIALKKPPMYDRLCRTLSTDEIVKKQKEFSDSGKRPVIRQAVAIDGETTYEDLVHGKLTLQNRILDDQILMKSDGFATYNFANVIDDHLMEITHIIRGEEFISSTPKYIMLYESFGWPVPQFAHLPLILNPDKTKLSKRQGDVAVEDFLKKGYLKEALVNFVVFLGWNPKTEQEFFTIPELIEQFELSKINKAAPIFDVQKLDWINSHYIREKSVAELATLLTPYWAEVGYISGDEHGYTVPNLDNALASQEYLGAITAIEQERLKKLSEITERTSYFFTEPTYNSELLVWKKSNVDDAREKLALVEKFLANLNPETISSSTALHEALMAYIKENAFDVGSVLWPLRVALTGMQMSPSPAEVSSVLYKGLGLTVITQRIQKAITLLEEASKV